ncbi:hypothetical protein FDP41_003917 [Naegleria fowleri]|uniref:F5/8 type C domain-containing protein n=1 Tax=Naegleria fowleri TaxID=5763 RepID=A0A6A5BSS7_NAEFO|nr:uncharacterized protein FDP41_003917 [Naegleria fowleri]KAF0977264.1 hypothetical protein FDP41_003917 [Naegleria fowleri]CAG4715840.1 unnamed protein product [Naegleria fowleri]
MVLEDLVANRKAKVVLTTSLDSEHPISNMLDDKEETFWISTGMFPQEIMFQCESVFNLQSIRITSTGIKLLKIECSDKNQPIQFQQVFEKQLLDDGSILQEEEIEVKVAARYIKFRIMSGYHNFVSVHSISIKGDT